MTSMKLTIVFLIFTIIVMIMTTANAGCCGFSESGEKPKVREVKHPKDMNVTFHTTKGKKPASTSTTTNKGKEPASTSTTINKDKLHTKKQIPKKNEDKLHTKKQIPKKNEGVRMTDPQADTLKYPGLYSTEIATNWKEMPTAEEARTWGLTEHAKQTNERN